MMLIFLSTYSAVLMAEIVGDKLLCTTGVLAARYSSTSIIWGMALAFSLKMAAAVAVGNVIAHLPRPLVAALTAASFIGVAITVWRTPDVREPKPKDARILVGAMVAFSAVFFSEWGDVGQLVAVAMAAKFIPHDPSRFSSAMAVWLGAVSAMVTKGALAAFLGAGVRLWMAERVSPRAVRYCVTSALLILGAVSVAETLGYMVG